MSYDDNLREKKTKHRRFDLVISKAIRLENIESNRNSVTGHTRDERILIILILSTFDITVAVPALVQDRVKSSLSPKGEKKAWLDTLID